MQNEANTFFLRGAGRPVSRGTNSKEEKAYSLYLNVRSQQDEGGQLKKEICPQLPVNHESTAEPHALAEETTRIHGEDVQLKDEEDVTLLGVDEEDARVEEKETTLPFKEEEPLWPPPSEENTVIKAEQKGGYQFVNNKVAEEKFISDLKEEEEDIAVEKQLMELEKSINCAPGSIASSSDDAYSEFSADEVNGDDPKDFSSDVHEDGEDSNFYDDDFE